MCNIQDIVDSLCCYCSGNPKDGTLCSLLLKGICADVLEYVEVNSIDNDCEV